MRELNPIGRAGVRASAWRWAAITGLLAALLMPVEAAKAPKTRAAAAEPSDVSDGELNAKRLIEKAEEILLANEYERGVKMLENVIEQYPQSRLRYKAWLTLGKHAVSAQKHTDAIRYLRCLGELNKPDTELAGDDREWYLESQYLTGVAFFNLRQFGNAFTVLRQITRDYPNSVWANQAYYYIGMSHFAQKNWNKAIEALSLVGTFIDPNSPSVSLVEAGRRFYVKIGDGDIPILYRTGKPIAVRVETRGGDRETMECALLSDKDAVVIGSLPTEPGVAKPGDRVLQAIGGDSIASIYTDENTPDGARKIQRKTDVRVVSTAKAGFTLGTFEGEVFAAYLGQPLFVLVSDLDLDKGPEADKAAVRVVSRYKAEDEAAAREKGASTLALEGEERIYQIRDEVALPLAELGAPPVHSGRFGGSVFLKPAQEGGEVDRADPTLSCAVDDEVVILISDELHIGGDNRREVSAKIRVVGEIDGRPIATQNLVFDPVVRSKKQIVEATAYLELTRIFKSMGLMKQAVEKSREGLDRVQDVLSSKSDIPPRLKEECFKLKWELHLEVEDYQRAIETCEVFSRLFPASPYADEALIRIGMVRLEAKKPQDAIAIFRKVLAMKYARNKAEAQYRIGEAMETLVPEKDRGRIPGDAVQEYKLCAERYPDSEFAGKSLGKLVDYYYEAKDYAHAEYLLEQVFQDYPDAVFLDSMLLKWVIVAYRMGNTEKALEKCNRLLFEYPESRFAAQAKGILPKLEGKSAP